MSTLEPAAHTLVVALDPGQIADGHTWERGCTECEDRPFFITFECPGIGVGRCEAWEDCAECHDRLKELAHAEDDDGYDAYLEETNHHGLKHKTLDGSYPCLPAGRCYVIDANGWDTPDEAWDIACKNGPGRYPITWTGGSDGELVVSEIVKN